MSDITALDTRDDRNIVYDRVKKGFVMAGGKSSLMTNSEILAVSKVLLDSRAFTKREIGSLLDKMITGCVPEKNMKIVKDLVANEKHHYVELTHKKKMTDIIWDFGLDVQNHRRVRISYRKMNGDVNEYVVEPIGILFSEYYFYLNAHINKKDTDNRWIHKYDYPAIFRMDRIITREETGDKFRIQYASRFEEGEFRKRIQFMYAGELLRLRFKFTGVSVEAVLDRLPTAKVEKKEDDGVIISADVYGKGIIMWLLSQGNNVEVLHPESLRNEIKDILTSMLDKYKK